MNRGIFFERFDRALVLLRNKQTQDELAAAAACAQAGLTGRTVALFVTTRELLVVCSGLSGGAAAAERAYKATPWWRRILCHL